MCNAECLGWFTRHKLRKSDHYLSAAINVAARLQRIVDSEAAKSQDRTPRGSDPIEHFFKNRSSMAARLVGIPVE
jgi:hypothetical protein